MNILKCISISVLRVFFLTLVVSFVTYYLLHLVPGDSDAILYGLEQQNTQTSEQTSQKPPPNLVKQYYIWAINAFQGNLGRSALTKEPVSSMLSSRAKTSFLLAFTSFLPALLVSIVFTFFLSTGSPSTKKIGTNTLISIMSFTPLTLSILLIILMGLFSIPLFYGNNLVRYIAPVTVLILVQIPVYVYSLLTSIHIVKKRPFITFARSLGFSHRWIWWREILPNALLFTSQVLALQLGALLGGAILVEYIFSIAGLGNLLVYSVYSRDIFIIQAIVSFSAFFVAFIRELAKFIEKAVYFV